MSDGPKKEIYTYNAPFPVYSLAASNLEGNQTYAVGSFLEEYSNKIQVITLDKDKTDLVVKATIEHPYPATRLQFSPESLTGKELLASSGDYLRLWSFGPDGEARPEGTLSNPSKTNDYCSPVTSFDWNRVDPTYVAISSIDTTCAVWDIVARKIKTQLIAHDKEVYDVAWSRNKDVFGTAGADGSLRLFDLRTLEHSSIMYEGPPGVPLLRLSWNKLNNFYVAVVAGDSLRTLILDVRMPSVPVAELSGTTAGHTAPISSITWAPHSACHICSGGDDSNALIWDLTSLPKIVDDPFLAYTAEGPINNIAWSNAAPDWVSISFNSKVQLLKV